MGIVVAFIAVFALGSGAGWLVNDWRNGAEIARVTSNNAVLGAANDKCAADVQSVRQGLDEIKKAAEVRVKAAEAEMVNAKAKAAKHSRAARVITAAPVIPDEPRCQAIEREQLEYLQRRRAEDE